MQPSDRMRDVIKALAREKADLDLDRLDLGWFSIKFELIHFMPLVIERIGSAQISVAHYRVENDDPIADPEVIFWKQANNSTNDGNGEKTNQVQAQWWPIEITQAFIGSSTFAELNTKSNGITWVDFRGQEGLAEFVEMWATNLETQGWLERATVARCEANYQLPSNNKVEL